MPEEALASIPTPWNRCPGCDSGWSPGVDKQIALQRTRPQRASRNP